MLCRVLVYLPLFVVSLLLCDAAAMISTSDDQKALSLTVYSSNLALVRDVRGVELPDGEKSLSFEGISPKILPATAVLKGEGLDVIEQNYEFDLLSPQALLQKYVGSEVTIVRKNEKTGEEYHVKAVILSTVNGVVLQVEDHIETDIDGRILYPGIPETLRDKPTLTMLLDGDGKTPKEVELSYLTEGLSWKADYVAELNETEDRVDLQGWVTVINNSGIDYRDAELQLIAGEVHRAEPQREMMAFAVADMAQPRRAENNKEMRRESMFEYHLYTIERMTSLLANQSKQISLLRENGVVSKEMVLKSPNQNYYWSRIGQIEKDVGVEIFLQIKNDAESNFGSPKPAGTVRVYKQDSSGFAQFIGEDGIDHTPENELIEIQLGRSFDVTADRIQIDFAIIKGENDQSRVFESAYEITLRNGKDQPVVVNVKENLPGDWEILEETLSHQKEDATTVSWKVKVDAKDSNILRYRVRYVMR